MATIWDSVVSSAIYKSLAEGWGDFSKAAFPPVLELVKAARTSTVLDFGKAFAKRAMEVCDEVIARLRECVK